MSSTAFDLHHRFAYQLATVIAQVDDWTVATPVPDWSTEDTDHHLLTWLPPVLHNWSGITLAEPVGGLGSRWTACTTVIDSILGDPGQASMPVHTAPFAGPSVETILDMVYTPDVYMHGLDLARASGLPAVVDPEYATNLLVGMRQMGDYLRTGGQYGPEFPPATIVPTNQWLYIGRDPAWSQA